MLNVTQQLATQKQQVVKMKMEALCGISVKLREKAARGCCLRIGWLRRCMPTVVAPSEDPWFTGAWGIRLCGIIGEANEALKAIEFVHESRLH